MRKQLNVVAAPSHFRHQAQVRDKLFLHLRRNAFDRLRFVSRICRMEKSGQLACLVTVKVNPEHACRGLLAAAIVAVEGPCESVLVAVVGVREVRMLVHQRFVPMPVLVGFVAVPV